MTVECDEVGSEVHRDALIGRLVDVARDVSFEHLETALAALEVWAEEDNKPTALALDEVANMETAEGSSAA